MSILNKSAAVATIIGTFIAAVALIYQLSDDEPSVVQVAHVTVESLPSSSNNQLDSNPNTVAASNSVSKAPLPQVTSQSTGGFESRIEAAMLMNVYSNKSQALQGISRDASDAGEYNSAIRAAREIEIYSSKDEALAYIARKALVAGKKNIAIEAAKLMEIYSNKDAVLSEIAAK
ncbi:MAG TPA: hypothetical protein DF427_03805 [Moraxellaceae bacterium]|nr:hypothetical protein [Moraxellaceae bacterium]